MIFRLYVHEILCQTEGNSFEMFYVVNEKRISRVFCSLSISFLQGFCLLTHSLVHGSHFFLCFAFQYVFHLLYTFRSFSAHGHAQTMHTNYCIDDLIGWEHNSQCLCILLLATRTRKIFSSNDEKDNLSFCHLTQNTEEKKIVIFVCFEIFLRFLLYTHHCTTFSSLGQSFRHPAADMWTFCFAMMTNCKHNYSLRISVFQWITKRPKWHYNYKCHIDIDIDMLHFLSSK